MAEARSVWQIWETRFCMAEAHDGMGVPRSCRRRFDSQHTLSGQTIGRSSLALGQSSGFIQSQPREAGDGFTLSRQLSGLTMRRNSHSLNQSQGFMIWISPVSIKTGSLSADYYKKELSFSGFSVLVRQWPNMFRCSRSVPLRVGQREQAHQSHLK